MTISKRFAEALGGDIEVTSVPNYGSQFSVTMSVGNIASFRQLGIEELLSEDVTVVTLAKQWKFTDASVLVVDDGAENRELIKVVLEDVGIKITTAENGQVALDKLEEMEFDVVLMDVQMPVMDGFTAVGLMRERGYDLPVIALTADAMMGARQRCIDAGYSEFMSKPIDIDKLINSMIIPLKAVPVENIEAAEVSVTSSEPMAVSNSEPSNNEPVETEKIYSSLPVANEKFRAIVKNFVVRLEEQMTAIDTAYEQRDYDELKKLGHWLKGSSGSVGFHQLVNPAKQFEQSAKDQNDSDLESTIGTLHALFKRIAIEGDVPVLKEVVVEKNTEVTIPDQLVCRLDDMNPRLRPIIEKFIFDLSDKIKALDEAVSSKNYDEVEKFAYWLKASAGSVGFDDFTEPARELLVQIKAQQLELVNKSLNIIGTLESRIVLSGQDIQGIQEVNHV